MKNLDFNKIIDNRKSVLDQRKNELEELKSILKISDPIEFAISDIAKEVNARKKNEKVGVSQLNFLENVKGPVVYVYEIVDNSIKVELLNNLEAFRSKNNKDENGNDIRRSTAKLPTSARDNDTNILYVGSVKEYVHSRTRQHLGFGHPHTFALQLKHWADQNWRFRFYYMEITNKEITNDIEAALSVELNPLIGKREI
ncbi:MAG TPA: hypothetical protein PKL96_10525 [Bacteroidales bacterium]|nr:hypothetical protein [Bacteroidales bacterium]